MSGCTMADDLPTLELRYLGAPTARVGGAEAPVELGWRKHVALLAYLAVTPGRTRAREHLLGLLWPEKPQARARHSLNEALRRLRFALGRDRLLTRGDQVTLNDDGLDLDVERLERAVEHDPATAVGVCRGEFLEGLALDDAPAFEEWLTGARHRYRGLTVAAHLAAGSDALDAGELGEGRRMAEAALNLEPVSEPAAELLMRASALAGDPAGGLAIYHRFRERFVERIGEEPGADVTRLADRLRSDDWRTPAAQEAAPDLPLIGREAEHRRLFSALDAALQRGCRYLVVVGAEGMGKTRLATECGRRARLRGALVLRVRPLESDHDAPFSTVRSLVSAGLGHAPGAAGVDPVSRHTLQRLDDASARPDGASVAQALGDLVSAVADETPLLLVIDDAHLADDASLGAVTAMSQHLASARMAVLLSADSAPERIPRTLMELMGQIGAGIIGEIIRLAPLADGEMAELVRALATWCTAPDDLARLTRRLVYEAGGSPFLAVTLLRDLDRTSTFKDDLLAWPPASRTFEAPLPFSMPDLVRMAICSAVSELPESARSVLAAASIGSLALDLAVVRALVDVDGETFEAALDLLEQRRFLSYENGRYVFQTPLLQQVVRGEFLLPGKRHRLRLRALEVLSARDDLESRVLKAELRAKTDPGSDALREALQTARDAMEAGAERTARRAFSAAEQSASHADDTARRALQEARAQASSG